MVARIFWVTGGNTTTTGHAMCEPTGRGISERPAGPCGRASGAAGSGGRGVTEGDAAQRDSLWRRPPPPLPGGSPRPGPRSARPFFDPPSMDGRGSVEIAAVGGRPPPGGHPGAGGHGGSAAPRRIRPGPAPGYDITVDAEGLVRRGAPAPQPPARGNTADDGPPSAADIARSVDHVLGSAPQRHSPRPTPTPPHPPRTPPRGGGPPRAAASSARGPAWHP